VDTSELSIGEVVELLVRRIQGESTGAK